MAVSVGKTEPGTTFTVLRDKELYSIGEVSKMVGATLRALRFYEEEGIVKPRRVGANRTKRLYSAADIDRLRLVKGLRACDADIDAIKEFLGHLDRGELVEYRAAVKLHLEIKKEAAVLKLEAINAILVTMRA